jgi:hypothetical protein
MKRQLAAIFFFVFILSVSRAGAQLKIAPEVGTNLSSVVSNGDATDNTIRFTAKAGAILQVPLDSNHFYFQPGLFYSMQGQSVTDNVIATNYIQIPANIIYKIGKGRDRFFVGLGLYAAYAVSDKMTSGAEHTTLPIGNGKSDDVKPFDFGGNIRIGHELYNGLYLAGQYSRGFINTYPGTDNYTVHNWVISVTVGYFIPLKRPKKEIVVPTTF